MCRKLNSKSGNINARQRGFTLTEVVVASSILAFAMAPVLTGLTNVHRTSVIIEQKTRSLSYAQEKLEEIKARSIYDFASSYSQDNLDLGDNYICSVSDTSAGSNLRDITVSTGYDKDSDDILDNDEIHVTLQTLLARRW